MGGLTLPQQCHIVNCLPPIDTNSGVKTGDYFHLENASHVTLILTMGVVGNATTFTVYQAQDNAGNTEAALGTIYYQAETTAASDTLAARTSGATIVSGTTNNVMYIIDIDASELTDGYEYLTIKTSNAAAALVSCVAVLSGFRYQQEITPTAID